MTINDLHDIIMGDGYRRGYHTSNWDYYSIDGCELLEHITDIPDFVSLLRKFRKLNDYLNYSDVHFVVDYSNPVETILEKDVVFMATYGWVDICVGGIEFYRMEIHK
jgi:hypothetical protein